jgi:TPP-dependent 2-oxoacid decarboxylase
VRKIAHHTLGDGVFGNFVDLSASAACCHAVITPDNRVIEMERVIAVAHHCSECEAAVSTNFLLIIGTTSQKS